MTKAIRCYCLFFLFLICLSTSINAQEVKLGLPVGHTQNISMLKFTTDDKYIVSTSENDQTLNVWEVETGKLIHNLIFESPITKIEINKSQNLLLTLSIDNELQLWDFDLGILIRDFNEFGSISSVCFGDDFKSIIFVTTSGLIAIWDLSTSKVIYESKLELKRSSNSSISSDKKYVCIQDVIVTDIDKEITRAVVYDISNKKIKYDFHLNGYFDFSCFSKNSEYLALSSYDSTSLFSLEKGKLVSHLIGESAGPYRIHSDPFFKGDDSFFAIKGKSVYQYSCTDGKKIKEFKFKGRVSSIELSKDEKFLLTSSFEEPIINSSSGNTFSMSISGKIEHIWNLSNYEIIRETSEKNTNSMRFSASYDSNLTVSSDGTTIRINKFLTGENSKYIANNISIYNAFSMMPSSYQFLIGTYLGSLTGWDQKTGLLKFNLYGQSKNMMINNIDVSSDNNYFIASSDDSTAIIWNTHGDQFKTIKLKSYCQHAIFSKNMKFIITVSGDNLLQIWDFETLELKHVEKGIDPFIRYYQLSEDEKYLCFKNIENHLKVVDIDSKVIIYLHDNVEPRTYYSETMSPDGLRVFINSSGESNNEMYVRAIDLVSKQSTYLLKGYLIISKNGIQSNKYLLTQIKDTLFVWNQSDGKLASQFTLDLRNEVDFTMFYSDDSKLLICAGMFTYLYDIRSGKMLSKLEGKYEIRSAAFNSNVNLLTTFGENNVTVYDLLSNKELLSHSYLQNNPNKWVHLHPSGFFDASPEAMELMYWTKGLEVIEFTQLKDRYWVPGLWEKVMKGEPLPEVRGMNELKLQPDVQMGEMKEGKIPITITKRDGGFGKVTVLINGKEVEADARGSNFDKSKETQTVWVDLKDHPNLQNGENTIAVKASSEDGFVTGRAVEKKVTMSMNKPIPHFYAVVIGTGKYVNSSINLKYPEKDAQSMSTALQLGAEQLFGKEHTHMYTLTTAGTEMPTKEKIKEIFLEIGQKSTSSDVVLVYLSGHGIAWGGDQGDFYYITTDATSSNSEAYNDEVIRKNYTISTAEFTEYLMEISALKQVMIIDACSSGKAVDNLLATRNIDGSQVKAIDRMKDRTGMFVISGSAADAVSYEASRYGQGLLTYSLLQAMKGASLRDGEYFDVNMIMNYARENVPKLASGIGGIQTPQLLFPKGGSFDIGRVNDEIKQQIPLNSVKPVFVRTSFMNSEEFTDELGLSKLLDDQLNQITIRGQDGDLVFLDTREFPDAYRLSGGYTQSNGSIQLKLKIKGPKESEYNITGTSKENLLEQIIKIIKELE